MSSGGAHNKSSSNASSTTTSKNIDMRIAAADGSMNSSSNIEANNSTVTVIDNGAVNSAFGFARDVAADAFDMATASQIDTKKTMTEALRSVEGAYADAKQGEQKVMTAVGLAVVAIVAVQSFKGK